MEIHLDKIESLFMNDSGFELDRPLATEFKIDLPDSASLIVYRRLSLSEFLSLGEAAKNCPAGKYLFKVKLNGKTDTEAINYFTQRMDRLAQRETRLIKFRCSHPEGSIGNNETTLAHSVEHLLVNDAIERGVVDQTKFTGDTVLATTIQARDGTTIFWTRKDLITEDEQLRSLGVAVEAIRSRA